MSRTKNNPPSLSAQKWMTRKSTTQVMHALTRTGGEARFVGGCVRDSLAGRMEPENIDIATPIKPQDVQKLLTDSGITQIPTGIEHGTITALVDGEVFEITTLRADLQTDGRHALVTFTDSWEIDARRRDFTINAIYCDPQGSLFDPLGGIEDLKQNKVQFIGNPEQRISEDLLRILRYFRFKAVFNNFETDNIALNACAKFASHLEKLSGERVCSELLKLLAAPNPIPSLAQCRDCGIIDQLFGWSPPDSVLASLENLIKYEAKCKDPDPTRRLFIFAQCPADLQKVTGRLKLGKAAETRLRCIDITPDLLSKMSKDLDCYKIIYRNGRQFLIDNLLVGGARFPENMPSNWISLLQAAKIWMPPQCPISGKDVLALGIPAGPSVGQLVAETETWWIGKNFKASRREALAYLKARTKEKIKES